MHWVYPQAAYSNYTDALAGGDPSLPPGFSTHIPRCTAYIFEGGDTSLRREVDYWIDRRYMITRGASTASSGGESYVIPTLYQVLLTGPSLGGILPSGAGMPSEPDELSSKSYVDQEVEDAKLEPTVGNKEINLSFGSATVPYLIFPSVATYAAISYFLFSGSSEWGTPTSFTMIAGSYDGNPTWNIRLYDITNAKTIATYTNFAATAITTLTMTNLTNIPTNQALFTIQATTGSTVKNDLHLYTIKLRRLSNLKR